MRVATRRPTERKNGRGQGAAKATLKIGKANVTAAKSVKKLTRIGQADVRCLQELKLLTKEEKADFQTKMKFHGFRCKAEECLKGPRGGDLVGKDSCGNLGCERSGNRCASWRVKFSMWL